MLWIKRNLLLVVGGLLAIGLLAAGLVYFFQARSASAALQEELGTTRAALDNIFNDTKNPFPNASNVARAKLETERLQTALTQAKKFFTPVPVPKVTGVAFRTYRDNTLADLLRLAEQNSVTLPARDYGFSFDVVKKKVDFGEGTFPAIPEQMAEIRAICEILFKAHISPLVGIKRAKVSQDDQTNPNQNDYIGSALAITTNDQAGTVFSPYEVTFHCLSSELASALEALNTSPYGFLVKAIQVVPLDELPGAPGAGPGPGPGFQPQPQPPPRPPRRIEGNVPTPAVPLQPPPTAVPPARAPDRQAVLLREKRLKVTLLIYAIRSTK